MTSINNTHPTSFKCLGEQLLPSQLILNPPFYFHLAGDTMELPYDCPLHVCKAKGFMAEKGEPTKLLIPGKDRKKRVNCNCGPVIHWK